MSHDNLDLYLKEVIAGIDSEMERKSTLLKQNQEKLNNFYVNLPEYLTHLMDDVRKFGYQFEVQKIEIGPHEEVVGRRYIAITRQAKKFLRLQLDGTASSVTATIQPQLYILESGVADSHPIGKITIDPGAFNDLARLVIECMTRAGEALTDF